MAADNSFDIVSDVDLMEASNAVQQALKEIRQRFDFKGSASDIALDKETLTLTSDDESKLKSVIDILQGKLVKRGVSLKALDYGKVEEAAKGTVRQVVTIRKGIPTEKAKEIVKFIMDRRPGPGADPGRPGARDRKEGTTCKPSSRPVKGHDFGLDLQFTNYRST